jgi:pimeloyl-ACP methyl ester carboxylesterase
VVDLPGVGHLPHEEAPGVVTRAILDWLQTSATSS